MFFNKHKSEIYDTLRAATIIGGSLFLAIYLISIFGVLAGVSASEELTNKVLETSSSYWKLATYPVVMTLFGSVFGLILGICVVPFLLLSNLVFTTSDPTEK